MPDTAPRAPLRRLWLRAAAWAGGLVVLIAALPPLLVAVGVTLDASPWRAQVAQALGAALQREVRFDGPAHITFSLDPELHVGGVRISNPAGFDEPDFATFGEGRFKLELLPLLRYSLHVRDFSASDVRIRLELRADGRSNWQFGRGLAAPGAGAAPQSVSPPSSVLASTGASAPGGAAAPGPLLRREDVGGLAIDRIRFERIALEFAAPGAPLRRFTLDTLDAQAPEGQPLTLRMQGRVENRFPYTVAVDGGSLSALVAGREAWPLKLALDFAGTSLALDGRVVPRAADAQADLRLRLRTDDLSQLEQLLQVDLPPVGSVDLATGIAWKAGTLRLDGVEGRMGQTTLSGALALSTAGAVPRLSGALSLAVLDLAPFLQPAASRPVPPPREPTSLLDTYRELQSQTFDLGQLKSLDADLKLEVGRWLSLPGEVREASLALRLEGGRLVAPMRVQAAGAVLEGQFDLDASAAVPAFSLGLSTQDTRLGPLARLLAGLQGVDGDVGRLSYVMSASGQTLGALTQSLTVALVLDRGRLAYGQGPGQRPVSLRVDELRVALPGGQGLRGLVRGALLDEAIALDLAGGDLPTLASAGRWPLKLQAQASGARIAAQGHVDIGSAGGTLRFDLQAPRAGSVARWFGLAPDASVAFTLGGSLSGTRDRMRLDDFSVTLGRTRAGGAFSLTGLGDARRRPLAQLRLDVAEVDVAQLQGLVPPKPAEPPAPAAATATLRTTLDLPILPQGIDLSDTDFALLVRRIRLPTAEIADLRFDGQVRQGHMAAAPFSAVVAGTPFRGSAAVDLRGALPQVALQLEAARVDVGELLRRLQVAEGVEAQVDALGLALVLRGSRLGEMIERSQLEAEVRGGRWTLRNPARQPLVSVALARGRLDAPPGAPVALKLDGSIDDTPVALRIGSGRLADLTRPGARAPFSLQAEAAGTRLDVQGSVRVPLSSRGGDLTLRLGGARLDSLNRLARADLPPWGPWSLAGRFAVAGDAYEMPQLELRVGVSQLVGRGRLGFDGERPRAVLALRAPTVQLDDFKFGEWSPTGRAKTTPARTAEPAGAPGGVEALRAQARDAAREGQRLLSRQTLLRQQVELDVEVDQVQSGADRLGSGRLKLRLQDARLELAPAEVQVPGGSARVELSYEPLPGDREVALSSRLRVDRFDYGVLARRIRPDTDLQGRFSLHFDLQSRGALEQLMQRGNGRLDLAVWPVNLKAGVFDLWAVNLLANVLPALDGSAASRVNCAVARFDLRDGRLQEEMLVVDTTRLRAGGTVRVDFHDESLAVRLQPRAKQAQFFSLPVPVEVSGTLTDFKVGVQASSALGAVAGFVGSIVTTPIARLTTPSPPADGSDVCNAAMRPAGP